MKEAVVVSAVRTAVGKAPRGILKDTRPDDIAAMVIKEALARVPDLKMEDVDDVVLGCAFPESDQGLNLGRVVAMRAGFPHTVPGQTVTRFCSSGLQAIATGPYPGAGGRSRPPGRQRGRADGRASIIQGRGVLRWIASAPPPPLGVVPAGQGEPQLGEGLLELLPSAGGEAIPVSGNAEGRPDRGAFIGPPDRPLFSHGTEPHGHPVHPVWPVLRRVAVCGRGTGRPSRSHEAGGPGARDRGL